MERAAAWMAGRDRPGTWAPTRVHAAPTSVDEQDVVLVDRTVNHVRVRLAGQQMLVEPLAAILEGLTGTEDLSARGTFPTAN